MNLDKGRGAEVSDSSVAETVVECARNYMTVTICYIDIIKNVLFMDIYYILYIYISN